MGTATIPDAALQPGHWYHTVTLPDGRRTPGLLDHHKALRHIQWPGELVGGRCLDVGTFDGFWAFEMERRGAAEVVGLDVGDPEDYDWHRCARVSGPVESRAWNAQRSGGFRLLANAIGSSVQLVNSSVYDLSPERHGMFDVVMCGAILLHLRDPVRALEQMRSVCRGTLLVIESLDAVLDIVARHRPAASFAHASINDQWWLANARGLRRMIEVAGFEVTWTSHRFIVPFGDAVSRPSVRRELWLMPHRLAAGQLRSNGTLHLALHARPSAGTT